VKLRFFGADERLFGLLHEAGVEATPCLVTGALKLSPRGLKLVRARLNGCDCKTLFHLDP
jgi:hypothetical protein